MPTPTQSFGQLAPFSGLNRGQVGAVAPKPPAQPDWMKPIATGGGGAGTSYLNQALARPSNTSAQYSAASDANAAGYQAQVEALNRSGLNQQDPAYQARLRMLDANRLTGNSSAAAQAAAQAEQNKLGIARDLTGVESSDAARRQQAAMAAQAQMFGLEQQDRSQTFQNQTMDKQRGYQVSDTQSARDYQDATMGKQRTWQESDAAQQMKHQLLMQQENLQGQDRIAGGGYASQERMLNKQQGFNREAMNTQRGWQTADTQSARDYQAATMNTQRGWQTADTQSARDYQDYIMNTQRGYQREDYQNQTQDAIDRMAMQSLFGMM